MSGFNWKNYRETIDVLNLPGLKKREELLKRQRYLFEKARDQMAMEKAVANTIREQVSRIEPIIKASQTGQVSHAFAKEVLPLAQYEIRDEKGYIIGLADSKEHLATVLHNIAPLQFNPDRDYASDIENQQPRKLPFGKNPEQQRRYLDLPDIVSGHTYYIYKVGHQKRINPTPHLPTTDILDRMNLILRSEPLQVAQEVMPPNVGTTISTSRTPSFTLESTPPLPSLEIEEPLLSEEIPPLPKPPGSTQPNPMRGSKFHVRSPVKPPVKPLVITPPQLPPGAFGSDVLPKGYYLLKDENSGDIKLYHGVTSIGKAWKSSTYGTNLTPSSQQYKELIEKAKQRIESREKKK
jgi:hypothetical protein